jgi:anti-sigma regulatory factor (Ser/Thr protein kinase)
MKRSRKFPEAKSSVPQARQFVAESLTSLVPEVSETAALLVSELATNAVVHAASDFAVTVVYPTPSGRVRVEVTDRDETQPAPTRPPPNVPHGRGLFLVATLADEWGVREVRRRSGKSIWFELTPTTTAASAGAAARQPRLRRLLRGLPSHFAGETRRVLVMPAGDLDLANRSSRRAAWARWSMSDSS